MTRRRLLALVLSVLVAVPVLADLQRFGVSNVITNLIVSGSFTMQSDITPAQLAADQNDYSGCAVATNAVCRLDGDSSFRTITGLAAGADGTVVVLYNVSANTILLKDQSTASTAGNRFALGGYDIPLWSGARVDLIYDSTASRWRSSEGQLLVRPPSRYGITDTLTGAQLNVPWNTFVSGAGAANNDASPGEVGHPGFIEHQTGTTTTGNAAIRYYNTSARPFRLGNSWYWRAEAAVRLVTLSDGTETYSYRFGFNDNITAEPANGVYFRYTHSVNSGNWQGVCRAAAAETVLNSSTAVSANVWVRLVVVLNPAGTVAEFFVNGASLGTCTSNIPIVGGQGVNVGSMILKSAGTTSRFVDVDYIEFVGYANTAS